MTNAAPVAEEFAGRWFGPNTGKCSSSWSSLLPVLHVRSACVCHSCVCQITLHWETSRNPNLNHSSVKRKTCLCLKKQNKQTSFTYCLTSVRPTETPTLVVEFFNNVYINWSDVCHSDMLTCQNSDSSCWITNSDGLFSLSSALTAQNRYTNLKM